MSIKTIFTLSVFIFCPVIFIYPLPSAVDEFEQFTQPPFVIFYAAQDVQYVRQAAEILAEAYEEIIYDLHIAKADSFYVYIMPTRKSFQEAMRGRLPSWTGAFAHPAYHRMVVKSPRWHQSDNFRTVLVHELFHLIIHNYLGSRDLPRWLDEGLAIFYSGEEHWKTARALSKAIATNSIIPLADIESVLSYHQAKADLAYQQCYSAVSYLLSTYDIEAVRHIIVGLKKGESLQQCFLPATGSTLSDFELEWQQHVRQTHRWFWFYEIDEYIWILIFVLVIMAFVVRKIRNNKIEKQWQQEQLQSCPDEQDQ